MSKIEKLSVKEKEVIKGLLNADTFTLHDNCISVLDIDIKIRKSNLFSIIERLRLRGDIFKEYYEDPDDEYNIEISFTDFAKHQVL